MIDGAKKPRAGEELDFEKVFAFTEAHAPGFRLKEILQFPKGHSNLTYLLVGEGRELVLRRPPVGSKVKSAHDMGREFRVLSKLSAVWPKAPRPVAHTDDPSIIGAPFYLMERIRGVVMRGRQTAEGLELTPQLTRAICESLVDTLVELHSIDYRAAGLGDLGKPEGYVRRQVEGWTRRYADAKTDDIPAVEQIAQWLAARIPAESGAALVHNDFKHDNTVLDERDPSKVIGVLDWEMSTVGDPLMDFGTMLGYWVEEGDADELKMVAFGPTALPGSLTRRELVERYAEKSGRDAGDMVFQYCFSLFKTAVVAQQIYARFKAGLTKDERFAAMIVGVKVLSERAVQSAQAGTIAP